VPTAWQGSFCRAAAQPEGSDGRSDSRAEFATIADLALEI